MTGVPSWGKRQPAKPPAPRVVTVYTIGGVQLTFAQVYERVCAINPDIGESKVHSRLSRGHRELAVLAADNLPNYKPKFRRG